MPINPNFLERLLLFRLDKAPAPILDLFGAASFRAVNLALDLDLFEELGDEPGTPAELADRLDADATGLLALLRFLEAEGYVAERDGRYRNTRSTAKWLTESSETNVAPWFAFWDELVFPFWDEHLRRAVLDGEPSQTIYDWFEEVPSRWETAQRGFAAVANLVLDEVAESVDVPDGATRLLDVGGGHGLYAIELCERYPHLHATVFDHPEALAFARSEIADSGVGDRVSTAGGDYWTDDLGDGYDVALVFNVVHAHDGQENRRLFERVGEAVEPGGTIAVLDQLAGSGGTPVGRAGIGFVGLTYLATLGAELHPFEDLADWLRSAGFEDVRRTSIRRAGPGNTVVQATKAG